MRRDLDEILFTEKEVIRPPNGKGPKELEDDLARIRAAMDQTLTAIENKFDSKEILRHLQNFFEGGPGEFGANLGKVLKENPIPVLMVCVGLAWLGLSSVREMGREAEERYLEAYEKFERKKRRKEAFKDFSHTLTRLRGKARRTRKEVMSAPGERRLSERRQRPTRRKVGSGSFRAPVVMGSLGAAVGAALSAALSNRH
jgi:phosphoglycolate phosphatase-like HAD superfamily hydrolase